MKYLLLALLLYTGVIAPATARGDLPTIRPDSRWMDTSDKEIEAQGGCVLQVGREFWWYGVQLVGEKPRNVRCYSSSDLVSWADRGIAYTAADLSSHVKILPGRTANEWLLLYRVDNKLAVAAATQPVGPFSTSAQCALPDAKGPGDMACFINADNKPYVVYTARDVKSDQSQFCIASLAENGRSIDRIVSRLPSGPYGNPALWKHGNTYYCTAGESHGWYAGGTYYTTAASLAGPWAPWKPLRGAKMGSHLAADSYNSSHNTVFEVTGSKGTLLIFFGDRWTQITHYGAGKQVWLPLTISDGTPQLEWRFSWHPDPEGAFTDDLKSVGLGR